MKTREDAWELLCRHTESDSLRKHMLAVEACMRYYAEKHGEDPELWGVVGLLHDFDYEKNPNLEDHPKVGMSILKDEGWPEQIIRAIGSHAAERTGVERQSKMEHALFAVDELSGFILAVTYVRPSRSIVDVQVSSVKKKMKDKRFAAAVSREEMVQGAEELGITLDEHISNCIEAMKRVASELGVA
jgi:putative nucleotidyltransferase with HDIG domain